MSIQDLGNLLDAASPAGLLAQKRQAIRKGKISILFMTRRNVLGLPSSKAPAQLVTLDLLRNLDFAGHGHLVTSVQQTQHEVEVHAPIRTTTELGQGVLDTGKDTPVLLATTNVGSELVELVKSERRGHSQGIGAVEEVREDVHILAGKCLF